VLTRGDITGLVLSYVYAFGMLVAVEAIGKRLRWPQHVTRKIIHIGAGMWVWGVLVFFDNWWAGVIPYTTFIVMNYVFYRRQTFEQMDDAESSPGTIYFAFSIALLFALLWRTGAGAVDRVPIAAAAAMAMTWGDALASLVGRAVGGRTYTTFGHTRTWEGSAVMVAASFAAIFLVLWLVPGSALSPHSRVLGAGTAAVMALPAALVAGLLEGVSPAGLDNLTVPLGTALALFLFYQL
jgi:phytol kinase